MRLLFLLVLGLTGVLRQGPLVFRYAPGGEALARRLATLAGGFQPLPGLPPDVLEHGAPVVIELAPDAASFDSLTGGVPDWGAGVAIPDSGRIVLPAYPSPRAQEFQLGAVLRHELAHVALHRYLAPARVPRWFDEGYATWASGGLDWGSAWLLRVSFALHKAPRLDSLELRWPGGETDARVAYLLSATAVSFLAERGGERALTHFLRRWRDTGSFEAALRGTYGITSGQFQREWRDSVKRRYGWIVVFTDTLVFWLLITPGLVVLWLVRRRRDRERLARLRETEPPERPAFWAGEEEVPAEPEAGEATEPPAEASPQEEAPEP